MSRIAQMHLKRSKYITHYLERNVYGATDF
uniref:Uncharacterized protein n=1 Tax=Siphoviridae sp. ctGDt6 TaxID=2825408 RepID=A0A8S5U802_9CAUD|nr:MAG TPA: hypothetical protein [Siphoviridae sp. ctGDt6]DAX01397.1 MAG TPA: hypothetical protein [Bacteriophage sp.]